MRLQNKSKIFTCFLSLSKISVYIIKYDKGQFFMKLNKIFKIINQATKYVWKIDKKYFALGPIFALVSAIYPLYNILPLKIVLDMLATDFSIVRCLLFLLCVLSFAVLTNFFTQWYRNRYLPVLNLNVQHETRKKVFTKSYDINYANFYDPSFYDIINWYWTKSITVSLE